MKAAWITDIHLNFIGFPEATAFFEKVVKDNPDVIFLTGDISHGTRLELDLRELERVVKRPVFFVLGNHDYWESSFAYTQNKVKILSESSNFLKFLTTSGPCRLSDNTCVIGHDGWYDMLYGDWKTSSMQLNDWVFIADLSKPNEYIDMPFIVEVSRKRAQEAVNHVATQIKEAVRSKFTNIIVLTHVPPFVESCIYQGKPSDKFVIPYFSSKMMGDTLLRAAKSFPKVRFSCFAGHTHGASRVVIDNLHVNVGQAEYRFPEVQPMIEIIE